MAPTSFSSTTVKEPLFRNLSRYTGFFDLVPCMAKPTTLGLPFCRFGDVVNPLAKARRKSNTVHVTVFIMFWSLT